MIILVDRVRIRLKFKRSLLSHPDDLPFPLRHNDGEVETRRAYKRIDRHRRHRVAHARDLDLYAIGKGGSCGKHGSFLCSPCHPAHERTPDTIGRDASLLFAP